MKRCSKCEEVKDDSGFAKNGKLLRTVCRSCGADYERAYRKKNREKINAQSRAWRRRNPKQHLSATMRWRSKNPDSCRKAQIKRVYGLSVKEYNTMVGTQLGRCAICDKVPSRFVVDHCHETDRVRGLLCDDCNLGVGLFGDSPATLSNATKYLEHYR